jgi:transcriptional regulator with XRE-family HTH domain
MLDIKRLLFETDKTQAELGEIVGLPQSAISYMMKGFRQIRPEHIDKWKEAFGEDLVNSCIVPDDAFNPHAGATSVRATVISADVVEDIKEELRNEVAEELKETVILTPEILTAEGIDIKKEIKAGTLDAEVKPTQDVLPTHHAKVYTETDEMSPEIEANDPVFVRFLSSKRDFIDGRMYFVDLDNGSVVRWVVGEDDEHIRLISMKDEKVVPFERVRSISEVVAITKRPKTLPKQRTTIEEVIAHKDSQIDAVNSQVDAMLEHQSRLIGIIEKKL